MKFDSKFRFMRQHVHYMALYSVRNSLLLTRDACPHQTLHHCNWVCRFKLDPVSRLEVCELGRVVPLNAYAVVWCSTRVSNANSNIINSIQFIISQCLTLLPKIASYCWYWISYLVRHTVDGNQLTHPIFRSIRPWDIVPLSFKETILTHFHLPIQTNIWKMPLFISDIKYCGPKGTNKIMWCFLTKPHFIKWCFR